MSEEIERSSTPTIRIDREALQEFEEWAQKTPGIDRPRGPNTPIREYTRSPEGTSRKLPKLFGAND